MSAPLEFFLRLLESSNPAYVAWEDFTGPHGQALRLLQQMGFIATEPGMNPVPGCPYCGEGVPYVINGRSLCGRCCSTINREHLQLWPAQVQKIACHYVLRYFMDAESSQGSRKLNCVVVDTSVWRAEPLLKTPLGVTLVYTLSRRGAVIGLPEVVELELKKKIVQAGQEAADKARGPLQLLRTITDDPFLEMGIPTPDKVALKVDERIGRNRSGAMPP